MANRGRTSDAAENRQVPRSLSTGLGDRGTDPRPACRWAQWVESKGPVHLLGPRGRCPPALAPREETAPDPLARGSSDR